MARKPVPERDMSPEEFKALKNMFLGGLMIACIISDHGGPSETTEALVQELKDDNPLEAIKAATER